MPSPQLIEGGDISIDMRHMLVEEYGVRVYSRILPATFMDEVAAEADLLHAVVKNEWSDRGARLTYAWDKRISCIDSSAFNLRDTAIVENIQQTTGVNCKKVVWAARSLLAIAGYESSVLALFHTNQTDDLTLHLDGENKSGFQPNGNFFRDFIVARGKRIVTFAKSRVDSNPIRLSLEPGDGYSLPALALHHGAEYTDGSLALYVQTAQY